MALYRKNTTTVSNDELFARIQKRAYELFAKRGYKGSHDFDDWLRAERDVRRELSIK